jgi:hypothetical protein
MDKNHLSIYPEGFLVFLEISTWNRLALNVGFWDGLGQYFTASKQFLAGIGSKIYG